MLAARRSAAGPLRQHLAGPGTTPARYPSSSLLIRPNPTESNGILLASRQCRYQGTAGKMENQGSKNFKQQPPPLPPVSRLLLRSLLGGFKNLGSIFKTKNLRNAYKEQPLELILALSILAVAAGVSVFIVYLYFTYFYGEHFTKYPEEVATALRKALYFSNIDQDPPRALKYYKRALELCDQLNIDPFTDEVMGIKIQVAHWLERIDNQGNATTVLENLLGDCKRWVEIADKAIKEGKIPESLLPPSNLRKEETAEGEPKDEAKETIWGKRTRILAKAVSISIKLGELYNDEHLRKPDVAHERLIWGVETLLKELNRRSQEGLKAGEGDWLPAEQVGGALESLAHSYETKDQFELALPLFFQALQNCQDPCHSAVLMNNIASCFAQHTVIRPGVAAIDQVVMGKSGATATPTERRASYLAAAQRWATNANQHATELKGDQRTPECDEACAVSLCNLGDIANLTGDPEEARRRFEQAISLSKQLEFTPGVAQAEAGLRALSKPSS